MDRLKAIYNTHANAVRTNDEGAWDAEDNLISLDESAITTEMARLQTEAEANEYARLRRGAYPDWRTQLEKIADDGIDAWKTDMLEPVKAKFPNP